ncbi:MAG TPA: hypothetical protein VGL54_01935 [Solirubrobacteraceae bacterium]|jgi:hypothetical protein
MGLLDDAIREHMELKRLRGADPSEVARQERDALGPVVRAHDSDEPGTFEDGEHGGHAYEEHHADHADFGGHTDPVHEDGVHGENDLSRASHPERGADFANVGQETAELDMRTVLDGPPEDGLEEAPAISGETPGQERLWFDQQQTPTDSDFDP